MNEVRTIVNDWIESAEMIYVQIKAMMMCLVQLKKTLVQNKIILSVIGLSHFFTVVF